MAQTATKNSSTAREAALARRRAMSSSGKAALGGAASGSRVRGADRPSAAPAREVQKAASAGIAAGTVRPASGSSAREASIARRRALSSRGKVASGSGDRTRTAARSSAATPAPASPERPLRKDGGCGCGCKDKAERAGGDAPERVRTTTRPVMPGQMKPNLSPGRAASLARRQAQSGRGKAGISPNGMSSAQTARAGNPHLSSRELARAVRSQRSSRGGAGIKKSAPNGRVRPAKNSPGDAVGAAQDQPWKVGASETSHGLTVTGTMVGRKQNVTGDEPSTCRAITGTEYLGADIFRNFCQSDPVATPSRVSTTATARGNTVTGNEVNRSEKVTGNEPGTCKRITGSEYVSAMQSQAFCGTDATAGPAKVTSAETLKGKTVTGNNVGRSDKVTGDEPGSGRQLTGTQYMQTGNGQYPAKVGVSNTLRGGSVTGTMVGRSGHVTGDEPGSCRNVTGDDYVGQEQYGSFCKSAPAPKDFKVGVSKTFHGEHVTGTMTGRSTRMTGDEPGTCKPITGTPYAGAEQYQGYCEADSASSAAARMQPSHNTFGAPMTGQQPGIAGKMTGDQKGACEPVTGTPYVGADQAATACPATAATPASPDFPQQMGAAPWGKFSVTPPLQAAQVAQAGAGVTGTEYEKGHITGPFDMGAGKVTGTEQVRFGNRNSMAVAEAIPQPAPDVDGRVKARISGEGINAGLKITGDDWDRGDHVTGTEGRSAKGRNPTRRGGPMSAMAPLRVGTRNEELPEPVSKVTGGSGNTEKGSLITYSGGARG